MRKVRDWTLWRGLPPPKRKKTAHRVGAEDVGALVTLGSFAHTVEKTKQDDRDTPRPTGTLSGMCGLKEGAAGAVGE
jgi:hypothetical protein